MALVIDVRHDLPGLMARIGRQEKQIAYATARALTFTARDVKTAEEREIKDVFDRPTPYTLNALFLKPATKQDLEARVWLKDERATSKGGFAARYLAPQIYGGARKLKRFEKALRSVGALPSNMFAVPGAGAQLDGYGNIPSSLIVRILAYFRAFPEAGYKANMTDAQRSRLARGSKTTRGFAYFVGRPGGGRLPLGVWQRTSFAFGSSIKPILVFVDRATYQKIFDFFYVAERVVRTNFAGHFKASFDEAMRTAR